MKNTKWDAEHGNWTIHGGCDRKPMSRGLVLLMMELVGMPHTTVGIVWATGTDIRKNTTTSIPNGTIVLPRARGSRVARGDGWKHPRAGS